MESQIDQIKRSARDSAVGDKDRELLNEELRELQRELEELFAIM